MVKQNWLLKLQTTLKFIYIISIQDKFISLWILEQPSHLRSNKKKIKHFLIDIEEPISPINVKQFQEIAQKSIKKEIKQNNLPFLVGGSGLYMNSITKGLFVPDVPPQTNLRGQLKELGHEECWELLKNYF